MVQTTNLFQINGQPLIPPDSDVAWSYSDLDSADSGRDESGVMHRIVLRRRVTSVSLNYTSLTDEEYGYMVGLLDNAGDSFSFTAPRRGSSTELETRTCYCSKDGISWHNATLGLWMNLKFDIIEC